MIADHAYSPGSLAFMDRRASLFYFAAAVPAVGFVHGPVAVNPVNGAMLESHAQSCFMNYGAVDRYRLLPERPAGVISLRPVFLVLGSVLSRSLRSCARRA